MSDEFALFGIADERQPSSAATAISTPIAEWQIDLLRKALDARNLTDMTARQRVIEDAAGREVATLRHLTHAEALRILSTLGQTPDSARKRTSAWDDRGEDTWIDRL